MASQQADLNETTVSRDKLADLLNEDLEREYQAIIAYVVYSQVLKGAEYMNIAARPTRAEARTHNLPPNRLSRQDAKRETKAGQGLGQTTRDAAVRPR